MNYRSRSWAPLISCLSLRRQRCSKLEWTAVWCHSREPFRGAGVRTAFALFLPLYLDQVWTRIRLLCSDRGTKRPQAESTPCPDLFSHWKKIKQNTMLRLFSADPSSAFASFVPAVDGTEVSRHLSLHHGFAAGALPPALTSSDKHYFL